MWSHTRATVFLRQMTTAVRVEQFGNKEKIKLKYMYFSESVHYKKY